MFLFQLRCPGCKNMMKYESRDGILKNKNKKCVYCGRTFRVLANVLNRI